MVVNELSNWKKILHHHEHYIPQVELFIVHFKLNRIHYVFLLLK